MRSVFHHHPFLLLGLLSLCLFFLVAWHDKVGTSQSGTIVESLPQGHATLQVSQTGTMIHPLSSLMRVLIVPMYLVWMVIAIAQVAIVGAAGLRGPLGAIGSGIGLVAGLAPYAFADYVFDRWRQNRAEGPTLLGLD